MADVQMITRPVIPPWNEGSKNTAWLLANRATRHRFRLMTVRGTEPPKHPNVHWDFAYSSADFDSLQKIRLVSSLIRGFAADIYHCLFVPTRATSSFLSRIIALQQRPTVQTVPSLPSAALSLSDAKQLFFGDKVVTLSEKTTSQLQALGLPNVVHIPPGIDLNRFRSQLSCSMIRQRFDLPEDGVIAIFSGELSRLGSVEILRKVLPRVLSAAQELFIVLACPTRIPRDREVRRQLVQFVKTERLEERVRVFGDLDDFPLLLQACDIYLFPVQHMVGKIDIPLTMIEAMAAGLPVIFSNVSPLNEIVTDSTGIAVAPNDPDAFASALVALARNSDRLRYMSVEAARWAEAHYSVEQMVAKYEMIYDELANASK